MWKHPSSPCQNTTVRLARNAPSAVPRSGPHFVPSVWRPAASVISASNHSWLITSGPTASGSDGKVPSTYPPAVAPPAHTHSHPSHRFPQQAKQKQQGARRSSSPPPPHNRSIPHSLPPSVLLPSSFPRAKIFKHVWKKVGDACLLKVPSVILAV